MNTSKIASEIIKDIYEFNSKNERLKTKHEEQKINENQFANAQYVLLCKIAYLSEVINTLKEHGYKFARYEKEVCALQDVEDSISEDFNQCNLSDLSIKERFSLITYLSKYEQVLNVFDDCFEELKDKV